MRTRRMSLYNKCSRAPHFISSNNLPAVSCSSRSTTTESSRSTDTLNRHLFIESNDNTTIPNNTTIYLLRFGFDVLKLTAHWAVRRQGCENRTGEKNPCPNRPAGSLQKRIARGGRVRGGMTPLGLSFRKKLPLAVTKKK